MSASLPTVVNDDQRIMNVYFRTISGLYIFVPSTILVLSILIITNSFLSGSFQQAVVPFQNIIFWTGSAHSSPESRHDEPTEIERNLKLHSDPPSCGTKPFQHQLSLKRVLSRPFTIFARICALKTIRTAD